MAEKAIARSQVWAYTEAFPRESAYLQRAREAAEVLGAEAVTPQVASLLTVLAATAGAQNVLEVGTGTGVSALALLAGMPASSALTTIDLDSSRAQKAKSIITASPLHKEHRVRVITGDVLEVLPRLSADSYDLILIDISADIAEDCVYQSLLLLQKGGLLILNNALNFGQVAHPAQRDTATVAHRRILTDIQDCHDDVFVSLLHSEHGIYLVHKR